jgi:hypothetical protein
LKLKELLNDILKKNVLGRTVAYVYTTELQKRGLPHVHMLCILDPDDKSNSTQDIDNLVSAKIPDPVLHSLAHATATKHMMHGPCGDTAAGKIVTFPLHYEQGCNIFSYDLTSGCVL